MKVISTIFSLFLGISILSTPLNGHEEKTVRLEILYMNHGPMQPTIRNLKELIDSYHGNVNAQWFDADLASGKEFMKKINIRGHIPLLIIVNGKTSFSIDGEDIIFQGFPTGAGPFKAVEGNWSMGQLRRVLDDFTQ